MGLFVSLILTAIGAILAWAVHPTSNNTVNVNTIGYILLAVGIIGLLIDLLLWESWGPRLMTTRRREVYDGPVDRAAYPARRRTVVEEDDVY